ncbi:hypothetical protein J4Q44_G00081060 [Coregonus suidteri]|uniref:Uncharacterized protein n=1 Tax=Coregonus suidteri TaxID=861788 RepID=A0AAN8MC51_9TELE
MGRQCREGEVGPCLRKIHTPGSSMRGTVSPPAMVCLVFPPSPPLVPPDQRAQMGTLSPESSGSSEANPIPHRPCRG